ncbi:MAG: sodium:calcium antiporter [Dehalococcoidia bacterium]|nr:sodium:calcium antiporter [Dehalococcoidia bacterium]
MTHHSSNHPGASGWLFIAAAALIALPALVLRLTGTHLPPVQGTLLFGLGILGAAFLISWTAEAAEGDISQALALAFLAFIAVLPEYAVDLYFAWTAPFEESHRQLAIANMTGANRLLIGIGWPVIFGLFWLKTRRAMLEIDRSHALELSFLAVATLYSFTIPLRGHLSLIDTVVLGGLFAGYVVLAARRPVAAPEHIGPAAVIGALPTGRRRATLIAFFLFSAVAIFAAAEPFAESLVSMGAQWGVSEFVLVQWVAPLASESPEFIIASLLALKGRPSAAMAALISSKVNQWTLLVGSLPLAFGISGGSIQPMMFDPRQSEEVLLTAAQSAFAVAVFVSLSLSKWEALALMALFVTQLFISDLHARLYYAYGYLALTVVILIAQRRNLRPFITSAWEATQRQVETPQRKL